MDEVYDIVLMHAEGGEQVGMDTIAEGLQEMAEEALLNWIEMGVMGEGEEGEIVWVLHESGKRVSVRWAGGE